jgi:hypothetical protein
LDFGLWTLDFGLITFHFSLFQYDFRDRVLAGVRH